MRKVLTLAIISALPLMAQQTVADKELISSEDLHGLYQVVFRHTINADPGGQLELRDMYGDVIIAGTDAKKLVILEKIRINRYAPERTEEFAIRMSGWLERIPDKTPVYTFRVERRRNRRDRDISTIYTISLPKTFNIYVKSFGGDIDLSQLKGEINIKTGGGDITVDNTSGRVSISTSGGDIDVFKVGGQIDLVTSGGDIEGSKLEGKIYVKTGGGDIELVASKGILDAETGGGDIDLTDFDGTSIKAKTGGGNLELEKIKAEVNLLTGGGDINVTDLKGNIEVATGGGDIDLKRVLGDMILYTNSGDVEARTINGALRVRSGGGDIDIKDWSLANAVKNMSMLETRHGDIKISLTGKIPVSFALKILDTAPRYGMKQIYGDIEFNISREQGNTIGTYAASNPVHTIEVETRDGTITIYAAED